MPYNREKLVELVKRRRREDLEDFAVAVVGALWPVDANRDEQWEGGDVCEAVATAIDAVCLCPYTSDNARELGACDRFACDNCGKELELSEMAGSTVRCECGTQYKRGVDGGTEYGGEL